MSAWAEQTAFLAPAGSLSFFGEESVILSYLDVEVTKLCRSLPKPDFLPATKVFIFDAADTFLIALPNLEPAPAFATPATDGLYDDMKLAKALLVLAAVDGVLLPTLLF